MIQEMVHNKYSKIKHYINQFCCYFLCIWFTLPYIRTFIRIFVAFIVLFIWFITIDFKWVRKFFSKDILHEFILKDTFFVILFLASFLPYLLSNNLKYGNIPSIDIIIAFPLFFAGIFIIQYYLFYKKDFKVLGRIALISLISYIIGSIQTINGLISYPLASRILSGGGVCSPELLALIRSMGIGGYGYIYSTCFSVISIFYLLCKTHKVIEPKYSVIYAVSFLALTIMLIMASYFIAITIMITGFILVLVLKKDNSGKFILLMTAGIIFVYFAIPKDVIKNILNYFSYLFRDNGMLNERFISMSIRLDLYSSSFSSFIENPLFGIYGPFGNLSSKVGQHSAWLDQLAYYGIFSTIPLFLILYFNFKKLSDFFKGSIYRNNFYIIQSLFVLLGFINPVLYIWEIGCVIFYIIPTLPFLPYAFSKSDGIIEKK